MFYINLKSKIHSKFERIFRKFKRRSYESFKNVHKKFFTKFMTIDLKTLDGATTLNKTTFYIMTICIMTISIMTLRISI